MNNMQHPAHDGIAVSADQLGRWANRLTEAIHFGGQVPEAISGIPPMPDWTKLDDAMRQLSYISTATDLGTAASHAKLAFRSLGEFRHEMYKHLITAADKLERYSDRVMLTFDMDAAQTAVKDAYRLIIHDVLGLR